MCRTARNDEEETPLFIMGCRVVHKPVGLRTGDGLALYQFQQPGWSV